MGDARKRNALFFEHNPADPIQRCIEVIYHNVSSCVLNNTFIRLCPEQRSRFAIFFPIDHFSVVGLVIYNNNNNNNNNTFIRLAHTYADINREKIAFLFVLSKAWSWNNPKIF